MFQAPVLATLDFKKTFIVECDALGNGIGVFLMEDERPIAFESRPIKGKFLQKAIYEKEMLAILPCTLEMATLPNGKTLQAKRNILMELHTSPLGGHSGILEAYHRVKKEICWDGPKSDIQKLLVECLVCQQNNVETIKTSGLLQPLSIPSQHWEEVSMDFITGLPKSEGKSVIMVVVDRLTKYAHFCALSHPFKASTVSTAFMETIQKLHGNPKIIQQMTPFMALYGYQPPSITSYLRENSKVQAVEHHIEHQQQVLQLFKDNLVLAQNRMKQQADQHRSEGSFDVIGDKVPVQTILPELDEEGKTILEPEEVTETRTQRLRSRSISEYLIKWKNLSAEDSTWEDKNFIQKHQELLKH
eukprot:PITA_35943